MFRHCRDDVQSSFFFSSTASFSQSLSSSAVRGLELLHLSYDALNALTDVRFFTSSGNLFHSFAARIAKKFLRVSSLALYEKLLL